MLTNKEIYFLLPPIILLPLYSADSPLPDSALKLTTSYGFIASSSALEIIAFASGCSLLISTEYASCKSSFSVIFPTGIMSVTLGSPFVIVPVLSRTAISVLPVCSREVAFLNKIPFLAPIPFPTITATGVARPNAQGQLITSTEIPLASEKPTV